MLSGQIFNIGAMGTCYANTTSNNFLMCDAVNTTGLNVSELFAIFTPDLVPGKPIPVNSPVVIKSIGLNRFGRIVTAVISTAPRLMQYAQLNQKSNQQSAPQMGIKFDLDTASGASVFNMTATGLMFNGNPAFAVSDSCPAAVVLNLKQGDCLVWTPGEAMGRLTEHAASRTLVALHVDGLLCIPLACDTGTCCRGVVPSVTAPTPPTTSTTHHPNRPHHPPPAPVPPLSDLLPLSSTLPAVSNFTDNTLAGTVLSSALGDGSIACSPSRKTCLALLRTGELRVRRTGIR
jgi:hypothetical protein